MANILYIQMGILKILRPRTTLKSPQSGSRILRWTTPAITRFLAWIIPLDDDQVDQMIDLDATAVSFGRDDAKFPSSRF